MPSVSAKQAKLMNIAAHTPGGYGGVPQSVGREFHNADKRAGRVAGSKERPMKNVNQHKRAAMGEDIGNTGAQSLHGMSVEHPDRGMSHRHMDDGMRGAPPPIRHSDGMHPAQAAPDHGPHHHRTVKGPY